MSSPVDGLQYLVMDLSCRAVTCGTDQDNRPCTSNNGYQTAKHESEQCSEEAADKPEGRMHDDR